MTTFSQHLFRALLPGFLLALLCSGVFIKTLMGRSLMSEYDRALISRAESLMVNTEQNENGVELEIFPDALSGYFREREPDYFEIRNDQGERLFRSASLETDEPLGSIQAKGSDYFIEDVLLPDGRSGRLIQRQYYPEFDIDDDEENSAVQLAERVKNAAFVRSGLPVDINGVTVVPKQVQLSIAITREPLDDNLAQFNAILLLTGLLTASVVVLLQRRAIRHAVRPIENISEQIQDLDVKRLDRQLTLSRPIAELDVLTRQFNLLMTRLGEGFSRERRFSADVAHEIRTPLAELRTMSEVLRRWPADQSVAATFSEDVVSVVDRMDRLIQNLLALSRGDLGLMHATGIVDLVQLVPHMIKVHQSEMRSKQLDFFSTIANHAIPVTGQDHWPLILENLIDNAVEYSPTDSTINLSVIMDEPTQRFSLELDNVAPELCEDDLPSMFDRLWRKEIARSNARHSGLGLSLVQMYVSQLGCSIETTLTPDQRFRVVITGPVASTAAIDHLPPEQRLSASG